MDNQQDNNRFRTIFGCILGTAIGDAVGLKREGLSRDRAIWLHGDKPAPDLIFGKGFCSDDTEHTVIVGVAYLKSGGEVEPFKRVFAKLLRKWLLTCPAGIGLGTLRAILKSFFVGPNRSGANSAGNGPAMRAGLIGVLARDEQHLKELISASTRITHADSRAEEGALVVAQAARFAAEKTDSNPLEFLRSITPKLKGEELRDHFAAMEEALSSGKEPREFAESRGWSKGPTGYVNQSVPMAIYCWAYSPDDFESVVTHAVLLGGDTDSVGAIAGAIAGAGCGEESLPEHWRNQLAEWPRGIKWMQDLSKQLAKPKRKNILDQPAPSLRWGRTIVRNLVFGVVVIALCLRRYIPVSTQGWR